MKRVVVWFFAVLAGLILTQAFAAEEEPRLGRRSTYEGYRMMRPQRGRVDPNSVNADLKSLPDPNSTKAKLKQFDGLQKALENVTKKSQREMREWMRGPVEERMILAKSVQDQVAAELAFIRDLALEEGALKTTAAIEGLLVDRQERFGKMLRRMEAGMRRMRRGERAYRRDRERGIGMRGRDPWAEVEQDIYPEGDVYRDNGVFRGRDPYRYRDSDRYRYRDSESRTRRRRTYERDRREQDDSADY